MIYFLFSKSLDIPFFSARRSDPEVDRNKYQGRKQRPVDPCSFRRSNESQSKVYEAFGGIVGADQLLENWMFRKGVFW